jgi:hypothetical protein
MQDGIAEVRRYHASLIDLIERGQAKPSFIVSSKVGIENASDGYMRFFEHKENQDRASIPMAGKGCSKNLNTKIAIFPFCQRRRQNAS